MAQNKPWYAGEHQDALFYLLIAIFFIELIVGGVAFFYGIIHATPETAGGPPMARFPWLAWGIAAILSPVALLLIVHIAGTWVSRTLTREEGNKADSRPDEKDLPDGMRRFYASVRHAPTLVVLLAILLLGIALFFVEGAFTSLASLGHALLPYLPWLCCSIAALLAICFLGHAFMVYRQRKMENEYAWRREVLEKTGLVLVDKNSLALPQDSVQQALVQAPKAALPPVLDISPNLPPTEENPDNTQDHSQIQNP